MISPRCCEWEGNADGRFFPRKTLSAISIAFVPEIRTSAIAPSPIGVEMAVIVSADETLTPALNQTRESERNRSHPVWQGALACESPRLRSYNLPGSDCAGRWH